MKCHAKVNILVEPLCLKCGSPTPKTVQGCPQCEKHGYAFTSLRSWAAFDEPLRSALHRLKYKRDSSLGDAFAPHLSGFVRQLNWPIDMVVPIPLGKKRRQERGYNQVEALAAPLAQRLEAPHIPAALERTKETRSQVGLSAAERRENMQAAFRANPSLVTGRRVLLMDDVATTGSTLSSAAEALMSAGAFQIYALTVARALPRHGLTHA
jgi:ComF family protein